VWNLFWRPAAASCLGVSAAMAVFFAMKTHFSDKISFLCAFSFFAVIYLAAAMWLGAIEENDLALLPGGLQRIIKKRKHKNSV